VSSDGLAAADRTEQFSALLPRLYERDIDVLLQEELIFNRSVRLLLSRALGVEEMTVDSCQLSVTDATGETDIFAKFTASGKRGVLLIENKINAAFQPRQPERYRERAASFVPAADIVFCVLIAPERYQDSAGEAATYFDGIVTYEGIAAAIEKDGSTRASYRANMLRRALEQAQSTYVLVPVEAVTQLWHRIYGIARMDFPDLRMPVPTDKGGNSKWVIFKGNLPSSTTIDWKIPRGVIDFSFWQRAPKRPKPDIDLSELSGASLEYMPTTVAIRLPLPTAPTNWLTITDEEIRTALAAAQKLLRFYATHADWFDSKPS
jgi:hypothetical protein